MSDDARRNFFRNILHNALNAAIMGLIWRLPTWVQVLLVVGLIAAIAYFGLY